MRSGLLLLLSVLLVLAGCSFSAEPAPTSIVDPDLEAVPTDTPELASPVEDASVPMEETVAPTEDATAAVADVATPAEDAGGDASPDPARPTDPPQPVAEGEAAVANADPLTLVSQESLLGYIGDLAAIQPYSGWRNSATEGEAEALDYVTGVLSDFRYLAELGLETERQEFHVFLGTEQWQSGLRLTVDGQPFEIPAAGLRGPRDEIDLALRFDSDGQLNDSERNPVVVEGAPLLLRSAGEVRALNRQDVADKIVFLDYEAIDRVIAGNRQAIETAWDLVEEGPAGLVLVTSYSNEVGRSHGTFVGDANALNWVEAEATPPVLYVRLEDLAPAGIEGWDDLDRIDAVRLTWDADVFSPAVSGNLIARIPGADPGQAVILGAHIDSPNGPGAMDDGSGSAVLLEVARVLDATQYQPAMDLYLAWFGSEELGLYGSSHFVHTHQELLDRTVAMLQIDDLTHPLDGIAADISLVTWSYGRFGDDRALWPSYLAEVARQQGIETVIADRFYIYSDNSSFGGFDVPHADVIYADEEAMEATGSLHYAAHIHDPYDTVELAAAVADVLEEMAEVALAGALEAPTDVAALRVAPRPDQRVVFVASHTEPVHMTPASLTDLGMAFAWAGYDVDLVPYGQEVTAADVAGADLVVALPVVDYPSAEGDVTLYDEAWSTAEIDALEAYVAGGGLLVLTNSQHRLKYANSLLDANEDWPDANALAERFDIAYVDGRLDAEAALAQGNHLLVQGVTSLALAVGNGVPFRLDGGSEGVVLAEAGEAPVVALVAYGQNGGQVLALADVGILGAEWGTPANLRFWQNLAEFARE
jgi:hypothetical protein